MICRAVAVLCFVTSGAMAQSVESVSDAVADWLKANSANGVVAIQPPDAEMAVIALGIPADTQVELASLSKSITAICAHSLIQDGWLNYGAPVSQHVPGFEGATVGDLITHQSGIIEDATQQFMGAWLGDTEHRARDIVSQMRTRKAPIGAHGDYTYSNDNYALLSLVIEDVADAPYTETCIARALDPAGAEAIASPQTVAFLSWGGWAMTVADYLKFHAYWYDTSSAALPEYSADLGGGVHYGLGMYGRPMRGGANHWHFGLLCFEDQLNAGTYAVGFYNDWHVVVAYDACVDWAAMSALDATITDAIFSN